MLESDAYCYILIPAMIKLYVFDNAYETVPVVVYK